MIVKRETYKISVAPNAFVREIIDLLSHIPSDCRLYDRLLPYTEEEKTVLTFEREEQL